jgi:Uma2 family endonuclease
MTIAAGDRAARLTDQDGLPPLQAGDRLTRVAFEQMYAASPHIKKAELIEGIVYMPSPTRFDLHASPHGALVTWLGVYAANTTGASLGDNASVRLDHENEVQPDALLRLDAALGGRSVIAEDGYVEGPPELVVEVAASSVSYDLHQKRRVYARVGMPEYIVFQAFEQRIVWFILQDGVYVELAPGDDGVLRSRIFPGLWLQPEALLSGDLARVLSVLQTGLAADAHAAFLAQLSRTD